MPQSQKIMFVAHDWWFGHSKSVPGIRRMLYNQLNNRRYYEAILIHTVRQCNFDSHPQICKLYPRFAQSCVIHVPLNWSRFLAKAWWHADSITSREFEYKRYNLSNTSWRELYVVCDGWFSKLNSTSNHSDDSNVLDERQWLKDAMKTH